MLEGILAPRFISGMRLLVGLAVASIVWSVVMAEVAEASHPNKELHKVRVKIHNKYPAGGSYAKVRVTAHSDYGSGLSRARVLVKFRGPGYRKNRTLRTNSKGIARLSQYVGRRRDHRRIKVYVKVSHDGITRKKKTSFLALGRQRLVSSKSWTSDWRPKRSSYITIFTKLKDAKGAPIRGARVICKWRFKWGTGTTRTYSNFRGLAHSTKFLNRATRGYKVRVRCTASRKGVVRSSRAGFIPR